MGRRGPTPLELLHGKLTLLNAPAPPVTLIVPLLPTKVVATRRTAPPLPPPPWPTQAPTCPPAPPRARTDPESVRVPEDAMTTAPPPPPPPLPVEPSPEAPPPPPEPPMSGKSSGAP